jgi:hypothetical protein
MRRMRHREESPADKPPSGTNWIHEIKHDGYRLMARRALPSCVAARGSRRTCTCDDSSSDVTACDRRRCCIIGPPPRTSQRSASRGHGAATPVDHPQGQRLDDPLPNARSFIARLPAPSAPSVRCTRGRLEGRAQRAQEWRPASTMWPQLRLRHRDPRQRRSPVARAQG